MTSRDEAFRTTVGDLTALGLSEYAARTLVTLTRIGGGTARAVSEASTVPRTRVYDAIDELAERDLVVVEDTNPKRFRPVPPSQVRRAFVGEYVYRTVVVECSLACLSPDTDGRPDVVGRADLDDRLADEAAAATDGITLVLVGDVPSAAATSALAAAAEGVAARIAVVGDSPNEDVQEAFPGATVARVPSTVLPERATGYILLVDERSLVAHLAELPPGGEAGAAVACTDADLIGTIASVVDSWFDDER